MTSADIFVVNQLSCQRAQRLLFEPISFNLHAGQALIVEGENGVGKSSLLQVLSGLTTPHSGTITWRGKEIDPEFSQHIHYLSHANGHKLGLTVEENLELQASLHQASTQDLTHVLSMLGLEEKRKSLASHLSAGQKRRLALARLLLIPKKIWLLDEPMSALDHASQQLFLKHFQSHLQHGFAVMSTHHPIQLSECKLINLRLQSC